jgi:XTP/dITP diphosphohydrolase
VSVEGRLKGNISSKILGKKGFGYDPIFIPIKKKITFGQMLKSKKIKMDHRYIAFQKLKKKIKI